MAYSRIDTACLLCGAATLVLAVAASSAHAQQTPSSDAPVATTTTGPTAAGPSQLGEVVVTATRQSSTVNKVAMSIAAVTQSTLDQQGVKNVSDLSRVVPGVAFRSTGSDRLPQIAIRGIASSAGAQTTGVYFDDVPLQETGIGGGPVSGAGTPLPQIFDLERVEVLKGPQGTLYGGSAEGGAIRFITPAPSLTHMTGYTKIEGSNTDSGSPSYNVGAAVGGPIIEDKLGFRASVYDKHTGGYIDDKNPYTNQVVQGGKDINYGDSQAYRLAFLWKPIEHLSITPSYYQSEDRVNDTDLFWQSMPAYTIKTQSYQADGKTAATTPANTAFTLPGRTYGPYSFGPYTSGNVTNVGQNYLNQIPIVPVRSPALQQMSIVSLNTKYETPWFDANLIVSKVANNNGGIGNSSFSDTRILTGSQYLATLPLYFNIMNYNDHHNQDVEELRFTSNHPESRLSWVMGLYRSYSRQQSFATTTWNYGDLTEAARGITDTQYYGVPAIQGPPTYLGTFRDQNIFEDDRAIYGEATFAIIPDKLKITAGARYERSQISYTAVFFGQSLGSLTPTVANGGLTNGTKVENPLSPKFGVSYQFDPTTMAYFNASKGYRVGGINSPASVAKCAGDLAALGITALPTTYNSDSVWNYETGLKTRLFGRVQWNSDLFYVDWQAPQTKVSLPTCGTSYVINAGHAISKGAETSVQWRVGYGLSFVGQVSYTDAHYTQTVGLSTPQKPIFVLNGDKLPVPPWSYSVTLQEDFTAPGDLPAYARFDYQYSDPYQESPGPGTTSYTPDTFILGAIHLGSVRAGVTYHKIDWSVFANNVFASKDITSLTGGRQSCPDAACLSPRANIPSFTGYTVRPREEGITASYRF